MPTTLTAPSPPMRRRGRLFVALVTSLGWARPSGLALADPDASAGAVADARRHYELGLDLYQDGDPEAAFVEFHRAYALVPNYRVLYNLGRIAQEKHDWAMARR